MTKRIVELVILAEDLASANFFYRYAAHFMDKRRIRKEIAPLGRGSGEQHVRENYLKEVQQQRLNIKGIKNSALIVHTDADTNTTAEIFKRLANVLRDANEPARQANEKIAIAVPRRHIETWIHGLSDLEVDETYDYKRDLDHKTAANTSEATRLRNQRSIPAAQRLFQLTRNNAASPPQAMPSLREAVEELRRLG